MDQRTIRALNAINRSFYRDASDAFDASRNHPWPGWSRVCDSVGFGADGRLRVLDVGCGNGRFGAYLADHFARDRERIDYTGIDSSPALLAAARRRALPLANPRFVVTDLVEWLLSPSGREIRLADADSNERARVEFDLIALFGVLHHIPGSELRCELLKRLARMLAPSGRLALTCWQFEAFARFRDRVVAWDAYNRNAADAVDTAQLESGDLLLPWGDREAGASAGGLQRYCHFSGEDETRALVEADFEIVDSYTSDGREGELNRYFICRYREV